MSQSKEQKTCFSSCETLNQICNNEKCRNWLDCSSKLNCAIIAAKDGPRTLQEIGDLHGLTRMRICQIEKSAIKKLTQLFKKYIR